MAIMGVLLTFNTPAQATETDIYAPFTRCPLDHPLMNDPDWGTPDLACNATTLHSGSLTLGDMAIELTNPVASQFGMGSVVDGSTCEPCFVPVVTAWEERAVMDPELIPGGLIELLLPRLEPAKSLHPALQIGGQVQFTDDINLTPESVALRIKLVNVFLRDSCYVGSGEESIVVQPVITNDGQREIENDPNGFDVGVIRLRGLSGVSEPFAVPTARGCGPSNMFDTTINDRFGLPSPESQNSAVFADVDVELAVTSSPGLASELKAAFAAAKNP